MAAAAEVSMMLTKGGRDEEYDDSIELLPPGFRFHPTDEEIITHYLSHKVMNSSFSARAIGEADFNKCEPWDLPKKAKMGEKEWYFFCQRDRKYPTGMRTNRATEAGYWKATGKDKEIYNNKGKAGGCLVVGMKKTLVFYRGRAPKGERTNWVMHEYRLHDGKFSAKDEWVVCRVFHKNTGGDKRIISPLIPTDDDLLRMNSFGFVDDLLLLDSPPSDYPYHLNTTNRPADDGKEDHKTFHQHQEDENPPPPSNSNSIYYQHHQIIPPQKINPFFSFQGSSSKSTSCLHQLDHDCSNNSSMNTSSACYHINGPDDIEQGILIRRRQCKQVEQFSSSNQTSMVVSVSHDDTGGLSNDMNTEISSSVVVSKQHDHLGSSNNMSNYYELGYY